MPFAPIDHMAGKRAYSIRVQKKGNTRRKTRAAGLEWFVVDQSLQTTERAPRGHRKAAPARTTRGKAVRKKA